MNEDNIKKVFASNIRWFIERSGKSQRDVAIDMGFEPTTFNTWCNGKILPKLPKLQRMAEYFNCDVNDLITSVPHTVQRTVDVSLEELNILLAYREAGDETKNNICAILRVKREAD